MQTGSNLQVSFSTIDEDAPWEESAGKFFNHILQIFNIVENTYAKFGASITIDAVLYQLSAPL